MEGNVGVVEESECLLGTTFRVRDCEFGSRTLRIASTVPWNLAPDIHSNDISLHYSDSQSRF